MSLSPEQRNTLSGTTTWADGDSGSAQDLLVVDSEKRIKPVDYILSYDDSGTNQTDVEVHDEPSGTASGDLGNMIDHFQLSPGDFEVITGLARKEVQDSLVAISQNNDDNVTLTAGAVRTV